LEPEKQTKKENKKRNKPYLGPISPASAHLRPRPTDAWGMTGGLHRQESLHARLGFLSPRHVGAIRQGGRLRCLALANRTPPPMPPEHLAVPPISTECREIFAGGSGLGSLPWIYMGRLSTHPHRGLPLTKAQKRRYAGLTWALLPHSSDATDRA
jgi:hypothetical protein